MAQTSDPLGLRGTVIDGKYVLGGAAGEGGAAIVYRAENTVWQVPVAVKFFVALSQASPADQQVLFEEFTQEGRLVAELSTRCSAIVQPRDFGVLRRPGQPALPYLVLEWLDGRSLDEVLVGETAKKIPPRNLEASMRLLEPVASALSLAHELGVAHRDIKPENMIVVGDARGPDAQIKLLDFGIAKVMRQRLDGVHQTGIMPTAFTPHYGAPEQFSRGFGETGPWSDVFALALVLLEIMRGGDRAFTGDDFVELGRQSMDESHRPTPRRLKMAVSDDVEAVFERALAVQPQLRYQDVRSFWQALVGAARPGAPAWRPAGQSIPPPAPKAPSKSPPPRRSIVLVATVGGILIIGAAAIAAGIKAAGTAASASGVAAPSASVPAAAASSAVAAATASVSASASTEQAICPDGSVVIPGGRFSMGTSSESFEDASPEHVTYVDTFCLDRTEVTVARYQQCVEAGWCQQTPAPPPAGGCNAGAARGEHPMNCVAWAEALVFCNWRGMRLPTEAEWELAAAGRGTDLPWGSDPPESRAVLGGGAQGTQPAGSLPQGASKDGALDLVGNVAEWVADFYGPYSDSQAVNPVGPDTGSLRVVRGGAWRGTRVVPEKTDVGWRFAAKVREGVSPDRRSDTVGFRCAKSLR